MINLRFDLKVHMTQQTIDRQRDLDLCNIPGYDIVTLCLLLFGLYEQVID